MMLTTSNLNDSLVPQRFQNCGREGTFSSTMPNGTLDTGAIREDITISGQVKWVIPATLHEHEVSHVLVLLGARGGSHEGRLFVSVYLLLLLLVTAWTLGLLIFDWVLHERLLPFFESEHLWWLIIVEHVLMFFNLVRDLSVHFWTLFTFLSMRLLTMALHVNWMTIEIRPILMLTHDTIAISGGVSEPLCRSMGALHAVWSLRPMCWMSQRLPFFNPLIYGTRSLLELIEVLLLLIKHRVGPILLKTVSCLGVWVGWAPIDTVFIGQCLTLAIRVIHLWIESLIFMI
jgi:hypothetical protein